MVNNIISIKVIGLRKVQNLIKQLPKNLQKEVAEKGSKAIAESGQRRILLRYKLAGYMGSRHGIKSLGKKMSFNKSGNSFIYSIDIPEYLDLIEKGVRSHFVSIDTIKQHLSSPGSTTGKRFNGPFSGPPVWWQFKGPFIAPGLKSMEKDIPRILEKAVNKAISQST